MSQTPVNIKIKADFDGSGLKDLEKGLAQASRNIAELNKVGDIKLGFKQSIDELKTLEKSLSEVREKRKALLAQKTISEENQKEIAKYDSQIKELTQQKEIKLGINQDNAQEISDSLSHLIQGYISVGDSAKNAAAGMLGAGIDMARSFDEIGESSRELNISTSTLKDLEALAAESGLSVADLKEAMAELIEQAADDGEFFELLGISVRDANGDLKEHGELLDEVVAKLKEVDGGKLDEINAAYQGQLAYAEATIESEKKLEAERFKLKKESLQNTLKHLEEQAKASEHLTDEMIAQIKAVKEELAGMDEQEKRGKVFSDGWANMKDMFGDLEGLSKQLQDNKLKDMQKSLDKEKSLIDQSLKEQQAYYDEQLEQYAGLERQKEEVKREHSERLEELNWKMNEHLTEDQYRALEEQIAAEEERFENSMLLLEEEALLRDELLAAKEEAEREAAERKQALNNEFALKEAKMKRKQAIADKAQALFNAGISIPEGIAKAWAQGGALLGPVYAAMVAAAGAMQIAAIMAKPLPEIPSFHRGGTIGGANAHNYSNLPQADNPYDRTLFWGQKGEEVLNLREAEAYRSLRNSGISLQHVLDAPGQAFSLLTGGGVNNSRNVVMETHITARNELTFSEARRLVDRQTRNLARALA